MSERDEVQLLVDGFCKERGYTKQSGSWYRRQDETVAVVNLRRWQHSHAYYLNAALWLLALGEATVPRKYFCHVRTRADRLVADGDALNHALDLERYEIDRGAVISEALDTTDSLLQECGPLNGCRRLPGRLLVERALVRGRAQELLADA